jgi:hypothetical protein
VKLAGSRSMSRGWRLMPSAALLLVAVLAPPRAGAQFLESDEVPRQRTIPEKQVIDDDLARSKFHLGPVRLLPSISVTNAGYDSNVFSSATDPFADWTATIVAGSRLLLPLGSKMYVLADVFPQYTWYAKLNDRDRWGGLYDLAVLGFFNRMSFQLKGTDREAYIVYSAEFPSYVFENLRSGIGNVDVSLTRSLSLFAEGGYEQVRYTQYAGPPIQDAQVKLNNSDNSEIRGGLRYRISEDWSVTAAAEEVQSNFQFDPELRDNRSIAYLGGIFFNRPRLYINAMGGYREGLANNGSLYPEYQTGVGSFFVSFFPLRWLELQGYGHRKVDYSIAVLQPYFFDNKVGGGANIELFDRVLLKGFVEDGPNTYPVAEPVEGQGQVLRVDHVKYYGGGLSIRLPARIVLTGLVTRQIYESNIPSDSRNFTRFTAFFNFNGEYSR